MSDNFKRLILSSGLVVLATAAVSGALHVMAAPTAPPASTTTPLPVTEGSTTQTRAGALTINNTLTVSNLCFNGGTCKTNWPTSAVSAANTALTSGGPVALATCYMSSNGSYSYNYQNYNYYCDVPFTVDIPFTVTTVNASNPAASCTGPASTYICNFGCTYTYYAYQALYVSATMGSGNDVLVSGFCRMWLSSGNSPTYSPAGATASASVSARYVY